MNPHLTAALAYARIDEMHRQADTRRHTSTPRLSRLFRIA